MSSVSPQLAGKTVVVTGATRGIGLVAAQAMAGMGARVILTARAAARGQRACDAVLQQAGHGTVDVVDVDFASMASIRAGAAAVRGLTDRVDILLNNAGAIFMEQGTSTDGLELTFATNHIGYFLWTHELLDLVKAAASTSPARIVSVSSAAHVAATGGVNFDDLQRTRGYSGFPVYAETKLMNILFTRELARRLAGTGVTANCLHPGVIASGFGTNNKGILGFATKHLSPLFLTSPEKGARTSIHRCTSPDVASVSGAYFANCKPAKPSRAASDDVAAARLWAVTEQLCGVGASRAPA
jgi:NAD(P)-dependent dehydrogenase (short-subunit alcohol dehydrogenase family)